MTACRDAPQPVHRVFEQAVRSGHLRHSTKIFDPVGGSVEISIIKCAARLNLSSAFGSKERCRQEDHESDNARRIHTPFTAAITLGAMITAPGCDSG